MIFQDYVTYQLTARENIGLARTERIEDMPLIMASAEKSGADRVIADLPSGYDTLLGSLVRAGPSALRW